jgi:hypothetical protein
MAIEARYVGNANRGELNAPNQQLLTGPYTWNINDSANWVYELPFGRGKKWGTLTRDRCGTRFQYDRHGERAVELGSDLCSDGPERCAGSPGGRITQFSLRFTW